MDRFLARCSRRPSAAHAPSRRDASSAPQQRDDQSGQVAALRRADLGRQTTRQQRGLKLKGDAELGAARQVLEEWWAPGALYRAAIK